MKVIGALFRLSKFFWAPLLWAAVISVFHVRRTWYNQDTDHIRERRNTMKVIGALFRLSKFFWAPLLWAAVISVFLFCAGRQRLIFWALYLGLILTAVLGIVYLVGEFTRNQGYRPYP